MMPGPISGRPWRRLPLLMTLVAPLWGLAAGAETITLRSGEHDGFSRLVLSPATPGGWALGRDGEDYVLRIDRDKAEFDISGVYRLIPRTRLADIEPGQAAGTLRLTVRCACHTNAFETDAGRIVIDIADGPPSPDSPYERPLAAADPAPRTNEVTPPATPLLPAEWMLRPAAPVADPNLALFRRAGDPAASAPPADEPAAPPATSPPATPERASKADSSAAAQVPAANPALSSRTGTGATEFAPTLPDDQPVTLPTLPDPRAAQTEADLLLQLSRAASQGLVKALHPEPAMPTADDTRPGVTPARPAAEPATATLPDLPPDTADHLAVQARTSIDRDMLMPDPAGAVTANGITCYPDEHLALSDWGDGRPTMIQIADRRAGLVGEFDRPSPQAVLALTRLYLHLGFGAEARTTLDAFAQTDEESRLLRDLAAIVDGDLVEPTRPLTGMTDCDTAAALWAVMARRDLPAAAQVDTNAVLRSFSALPPSLRRALGGGLADRFIAAGKLDAARALRDAIARAPGEAGPTIAMIDARLDLARGKSAAGEAALDRIAETNDPLSPEALIMTIRSRIDRGEPVDPALADTAEALAYERRDTAQAAILDQASILARASAGDFDRAFAALDRRWGEDPDATGNQTTATLFALLAASPDDAAFVRHAFANLSQWENAAPDTAARLAVATRLVRLGLAEATRRVLTGDAAGTADGRRLLAEAALAEFDATGALDAIAGLDDSASAGIRARAQALAGDHRAAAASLAEAGDTAAAADQAWRGADWQEVGRIGPKARRDALRLFGLISGDASAQAAQPAAPPPEPGSLALGRALLDQSRAARETIAGLLSPAGPATGVAAPAAPGTGAGG